MTEIYKDGERVVSHLDDPTTLTCRDRFAMAAMTGPFEALSAELKALQEHQDREYKRLTERLDQHLKEFKSSGDSA